MRRDRESGHPKQIVLDGSLITGTTTEISAAIRLVGYSVSEEDREKVLAIRGGKNFELGAYRINSIDLVSNTWTLDRPCSKGAGEGLVGEAVREDRKRHDEVLEFYDSNLPNNAGQGKARDLVLTALDLVEPKILISLGKRCCKPEFLDPPVRGIYDWCGPVDFLMWGHIKGLDRANPSLANLLPLKNAISRWATDNRLHRWNLLHHDGECIDWIADAAVQTLVWWHQKGRLPKRLRWENLGFYCYRSLNSDDAFKMFEAERRFDAGSGYLRIAPESGVDYSGLSDREQRAAKKEYKSLGEKEGLTRIGTVSARYFEWYVLRMFLKLKLREIREREIRTTRAGRMGVGVGDSGNPDDLAAISIGIKVVADLVGFQRKRTKVF